jgi:hypothetical protein
VGGSIKSTDRSERKALLRALPPSDSRKGTPAPQLDSILALEAVGDALHHWDPLGFALAVV